MEGKGNGVVSRINGRWCVKLTVWTLFIFSFLFVYCYHVLKQQREDALPELLSSQYKTITAHNVTRNASPQVRPSVSPLDRQSVSSTVSPNVSSTASPDVSCVCCSGVRSSGRQYADTRLRDRMSEDFNCCLSKTSLLDPFPYIKGVKNPCWWDDNTLRCLPAYHIIGFRKSGSSDLFQKLGMHPNIWKLHMKEVHWIEYLRFTSSHSHINNYTDYLGKFTDNMRETNFRNKEMIVGDGSPNYISNSFYWRCVEGNERLTEPRYTNADVIRRMTPSAKIIVIMRDPVEKLFSGYLFWRFKFENKEYKELNEENFHKMSVQTIEEYNKCFQRNTVRACVHDGNLFGRVRFPLQEGMYSVLVKDWLDVFPRDQLLFLRFEDYVQNTLSTLDTVFQFLDIGEAPPQSLSEMKNDEAHNVRKPAPVTTMWNKTRLLLQQFYSPFVKDLAELIGPQFTWGY